MSRSTTIENWLQQFELQQGVYVSAAARQKFAAFENAYLGVREKEQRVLPDEAVRQLPQVASGHVDEQLWRIRRKSIARFLKYLAEREKNLNVLDIGCGNGFFTALLQGLGHNVVGVDVNLTELQQAARVFSDRNCTWLCADVMNDALPQQHFDVITFVCSFQYFENTVALLNTCMHLLKPGGSLHIIDSPFYKTEEIEPARARSASYFEKQGIEAMRPYYHHHNIDVLAPYATEVLYQPHWFKTKVLRDSPFPWLCLKR